MTSQTAPAEVAHRIAQILAKPKRKTVTVLSSLIAIQDEFGYIPPEAISAIAEKTGDSINDVYGVATFYTHFRLSPPTEHTVEVCWGPSCHVVGAPEIMRAMEEELAIKGQGDTPDGMFTLKRNSCAAACAQGPVIVIDHQVCGRLTPQAAQELIRNLKNHRG